MQFFAEFIGHFHPVIVHLPIGILLIAALFYGLSQNSKYQALRPAVSVSLLLGTISAVVACLTGWLLSTTDDYDTAMVEKHQWLGIATAAIAWICYACERRNVRYSSFVIVLMVLMISVTGHLGGSITHGDGYLTEAFYNYSGSGDNITPIANVQEALVYDDVIQPILATRCYSCHGQRKQKGGLRLDEKDFILKGGKNGAVIILGDAGSSELVQRIFLPHENEDHMPPKEKPQLTAAQKDLIKWWIAEGAPFNKKISDLNQSPDVTLLLAALGKGNGASKLSSSVPEEPVEEAPADALAKLVTHGAIVVPVAQNSHYLSVNLVNAEASNDSVMTLLQTIGKQIVWLKTGTYPVDGEGLKKIGQLRNLTRLQISNLKGSQNELQHLDGLKNLQYLNLTGAKLTRENAKALQSLSSLKNLFLYQSGISSAEYSELSKSLKGVQIDTGAYFVPTFASDTTEVHDTRK